MQRLIIRLLVPALLAAATAAQAHNAICSCFDNGDESITCEGGFSDGATAAGVPLKVLDQSGKVLVEGALDKSGEFKFARPKVPFRVELNAGEGHVVKIDGRDIEK
ncbi:MAG: hypothetical protein M3Y79_10960 [Pseudomonadota bacterium]|nr:hypothetical protein [Pseudomonadota bacterium]